EPGPERGRGGQGQQGEARAAREAVHEADQERPQATLERMRVAVLLRLLPAMGMEVDVGGSLVLMGMRVQLPAQGAAEGERAQDDEHDRDYGLETVAHRG